MRVLAWGSCFLSFLSSSSICLLPTRPSIHPSTIYLASILLVHNIYIYIRPGFRVPKENISFFPSFSFLVALHIYLPALLPSSYLPACLPAWVDSITSYIIYIYISTSSTIPPTYHSLSGMAWYIHLFTRVVNPRARVAVCPSTDGGVRYFIISYYI